MWGRHRELSCRRILARGTHYAFFPYAITHLPRLVRMILRLIRLKCSDLGKSLHLILARWSTVRKIVWGRVGGLDSEEIGSETAVAVCFWCIGFGCKCNWEYCACLMTRYLGIQIACRDSIPGSCLLQRVLYGITVRRLFLETFFE